MPQIFKTALILACALAAGAAYAQAGPRTFTHHGFLEANQRPYDGTQQVRFEIIADGESVFQEEEMVTFEEGYYTALLGDDSALPGDLGAYTDVALRITIIEENGGEVVLSPDQPFSAVPYAYSAYSIHGGPVVASSISVGDGASDTTPVIDTSGAWTGAAMGSANIGVDAVNSSHILNGSVTADDIQNGTIGIEELKDEIISTTKLQDLSVSTDKLQAESVTGAAVAPNAIEGFHIQDGAISSADVGNGTLRAEDVRPGGGIYASRGDLYSATDTGVIFAGRIGRVTVTCADTNDLPLQVICPVNNFDRNFELLGVDANDWSDDSTPASGSCVMKNITGDDLSYDRATMICISVD